MKNARENPPSDVFCNRSPARSGEIHSDLKKLLKEKGRLEKILATDATPKKQLTIYFKGNAAKWYISEDGARAYLPKSERDEAVRLAKFAWCRARLSEINTEILACQRYLRVFRHSSSHLQILLKNKEFCNLIGESSPDIEEWKNSSFQKNPTHPEHLQYTTNTGLCVRSKSEVLIATSLEKHAIPFRYECLLDTPSGPIYPDFTIMHPKTRRLYIWEHFGMIDNQAYSAKSLPKICTYSQLGYFPNDNLIMTFESKDHPFNLPEADDLVRKYFLSEALK